LEKEANQMNSKQLYQWVETSSKDWHGFTRHFRENLRVFSQGVVRAQSSQIRKIAGATVGRAESQRRRLQRFLQHDHSLKLFFQYWTQTLIERLKLKEIVLVVDETKLKAQLGVMVVGLLYKARCIPLAWRIYRANSASDYPVEGQARMIIRLLKQVRGGIARHLPVRVLADRGVGTSPLLMRGIIAMGWQFLFRVTKQSKIVMATGEAICFYDQVQQQGQSYHASGLVFKKRGRIPAHVRVLWRQGGQEPWALVTNDPQLSGWEYAQRMWIEEAFRDLKSHGWDVENASLASPERMSRLWMILVVAYAWMLVWGTVQEATGRSAPLKRRSDGTLVRRWSLFREGRQAFLTANPFP
jgi:hypothetical protein